MLRKNFHKKYQKTISKYILYLIYLLKKKIPKNDIYPFEIINYLDAFGVQKNKIEKSSAKGYEKLYLVGSNWLNNKTQPIILFLGFNDWKFGFISDYFPKNRCAFGSRKSVNIKAIRTLKSLKPKVHKVAIWGYNDSKLLRFYLWYKKYSVIRIEDGFIRSASLGATHATPYSLAIDKTGIYYNNKKNDLQRLLNKRIFIKNKTLMAQGKASLKNLRESGITKYNPIPIHSEYKIKINKRIAILGQVPNDASIRYGNPNKWRTFDLIKLARYENPSAEIFYRPHPEVFQKYQKDKTKHDVIQKLCYISPPEGPLSYFLEDIDHVYTITSLSGLEALIRGIKVTTVGTPFYAGWGLTDDRAKIKNRKQKLSLLELFVGAYLCYPKYLASPVNSHIGLTASLKQIFADIYQQEAISINKTNNIYNVYNSRFNSAIFTKELSEKKDQLSAINIAKQYLSYNNNPNSDYILISYILGKFNSYNDINYFIKNLKESINPISLSKVIMNTIELYGHNPVLYGQYAYLLSHIGSRDISDKIQKDHIDNHEKSLIESHNQSLIKDLHPKDKNLANNENINTSNHYQTNEPYPKDISLIKNSLIDVYQTKYQLAIKNNDFQASIEIIAHLFLLGDSSHQYFLHAIELLENNFNYNEAYIITKFCCNLDPLSFNRKFLFSKINLHPLTNLCHIKKTKKHEEELWLYIILNSGSAYNIASKINDGTANKSQFSDKNFNELFCATINLKPISLTKAMALIDLNKYHKALEILLYLIKQDQQNYKYLVQYSILLVLLGHISTAYTILKKSSMIIDDINVIKESLRVMRILGKFEEGLDVINSAKERGLDIPATLKQPFYLGLGHIFEGYALYQEIPFRDELIGYFPNTYLTKVPEKRNTASFVVLSAWGPGDEIRFASLYSDIIKFYSLSNIIFTCDERLLPLYTRSFPDIEFIPVRRTRSFDSSYYHPSLFNEIPNAKLRVILDNKSYKTVSKMPMILISDLITLFRKEYKSFSGDSVFITNKDKVNTFKNRIKKINPNNKYVIGLNWRSSMDDKTRSIHYLDIKQLSPLFKMKEIIFINLQYDECKSELEWVEKEFPNKLYNFSDIDQYNDFDTVSALMKSLDMVIAPCTSVAELAGSLGVKTILFGNSAEIEWRNSPITGSDVWFKSITIETGSIKSDKTSTVIEIKKCLNNHLLKNNID